MGDATTKTPLGASTTVGMWQLDVNTGTYGSPTWVVVNGMGEITPNREATMQDDTDMDSAGYKSETKTGEAWALEFKVFRKTLANDVTAYDPGQEFLRLKAEDIGSSNVADVRYYEMADNGPREQAYRGYCTVGWSPDGGKVDDLDVVSVRLGGRGRLTAITHPDA